MTISTALALTVAFSVSLLAQISATQPASYRSNPEFLKVRQEAEREMETRTERVFAIGHWKKANKIAGGHCSECYAGMVTTALRSNDPKQAVGFAREMLQAADTPKDRLTAEVYLGKALLQQARTKKGDPALLQEAHTQFAAALAAAPALSSIYFLDGQTLALLNRDDEARAVFTQCGAHLKPEDPIAARARHFAENPQLARQPMAPPVVVTTLAGKQFNLDDMKGRVVLIDFWAAWCPPCIRELPHLQKLAKKYQDAPFEIISVSWDRDEAKWKEFVAQHQMTWNQYRDADYSVTNTFGIHEIPRYFTIDSDGVLAADNLGSGADIDGRIDKLVKRAQETREKAPASVAAIAPEAAASSK